MAITGLGVISAVGRGVASMDAALAAGRDGLGPLSLWDTDLAGEFPVGQYRGDLDADLAEVGLAPTRRSLARMSRSDKLALVACAEACAHAGLSPAALNRLGAGAFVGQSVCGTLASEAQYQRARAGHTSRRGMGAMFTHEGANTQDQLARHFHLGGPTLGFMTACSSGANAIGLAAARVAAGQCEVMLAGGADSLSRIAVYGFHSLQVVSPEGPRPFDANRKGMSVGEGAGFVVLEALAHARQRGATPLALLTGYGHSCDAHHLTAPHPQGAGAIAAMRGALAMAGLEPRDIGYINAHGTATLDNDRTEALAIASVFAQAPVPVSSVKRFFGHTLAAAGAIEAVVCARALQTETLPQNLGLQTPLPEAALDLVRSPRHAPGLRHVLSNSFGFGGNNAALLFSATEAAWNPS
ncbi:MAG: beta-ketoacyl-[acyl-carrier-protein] synthase family protein [Planctomycetes bacterium]|nr:beta-ketoacyl-[acyl-carrier-protein] synthase family protein [Planctomycetota bacterium]